MADIAQSAVFVRSVATEGAAARHGGTSSSLTSRSDGHHGSHDATPLHVQGPCDDFQSVPAILRTYDAVGFQATNYGRAVRIARQMLQRQPASRQFIIQDGEFVAVPEADGIEPNEGDTHATAESKDGVYPTLFFGMTANLFGTGCREAARFLVKYGSPHRSTTSPPPGGGEADEEEAEDVMWCAERGDVDESGGRCLSEEASWPTRTRSFLSALVTSGGGIEHDIRRACEVYHVERYASEEMYHSHDHRGFCGAKSKSRTNMGGSSSNEGGSQNRPATPGSDVLVRNAASTSCPTAQTARFGNIRYTPHDHARRACSRTRDEAMRCSPAPTAQEDHSVSVVPLPSLFDRVMQLLVQRLLVRQAKVRARYTPAHGPNCSQGGEGANDPSRVRSGVGCVPSACTQRVAHTDPCPWMWTPREVWRVAGLWLPQLLYTALCERSHGGTTERATLRAHALHRAQSSVVYWAARRCVPIFCPSFADGDIMHYVLDAHARGANSLIPSVLCEKAAGGGRECRADALLQMDLVGDIHALNKMAMLSKRTGMIICGGGVVKHHICNANLMRNGADYAIFINNGAEFDGSDAGARPDEAVSWGKIRIDGESVKIYSEVTAVLPLLVTQVFVPAAQGAPAA